MLTGSVIDLRPPLDEDLPFLLSLRNDPDMQQSLMCQARANTRERVKRWLDSRLGDQHTLFFMIARRADKRAVGFIQIREMHSLHGHGELGICVAALAQGTGAAREALDLAGDYARDTFRLRKLTLRVLASNERAIAFYGKTGFRLVGRFERHYYFRRQFHDVVLMEKFLDAGNFQAP